MSSGQALRPPEDEVNKIPKLFDFKHTKTRLRVFTHRSYYARPNAVFEDPPGDDAQDNETLEFVGDSVLNLSVATLVTTLYPGLRVGPLAKIRSLVVQNVTIAQISEHYGLAQQLRANTSQLFNLRFSPAVQADLFEAYLGGLYTDWGYEHIRPWLFRVLRPYVDEAYRTVQREYIEPSPGRLSRPPAPNSMTPRTISDVGASRWSPQVQTLDQTDGSPRIRESISRQSATLMPPGMESVIQVNSMYSMPDHPADVFESRSSVATLGSVISSPPRTPATGPAVQAGPESRQFMASAVAEGHLPLLNQVLQHAKRWIDWDYVLDPKAPSTTPIWDAYGKMSGVKVCDGRGNTKKLAKNDAARWLVTELQNKIGRQCTTSDLAKELIAFHTEKKALAGFEDEKILSGRLKELNLSEARFGARRQSSLNYAGIASQMD